MVTPFIAAMIECGFLAAFAVLIFCQSSQLQDFGTSPLSAGLFPAIMAAFLLVLSVVLAVQNYRGWKKDGDASAQLPKSAPGALSRHVKALLLFLLGVGYTLILPVLHFFAASVVFMLAFLLMAGERRWWALALVAFGLSGILQLVFGAMLNVMLP